VIKNKAIIFDLDGVICHTDEFHFKAWKRISDENNLKFDRTLNEKLKGVSRLDCYNIILDENNKQQTEEEKLKTIDIKNNYYRESLNSMDTSYLSRDVSDTLNKLREKEYPLAIGSSSKNAKFILEKIGLQTFFDAISDGNDIKYSKPNPQVFQIAAGKLKMDPKNCFVVEDAFSGVQAGLNAEMKVFAYNQNETNFNNPDVVKINKISDLLNFF
jgi:beta-phosphoglucomutase